MATLEQLKAREQKFLAIIMDSASSISEREQAAKQLKRVREEMAKAQTGHQAKNLISAALKHFGVHSDATRGVASTVGGMLGSALAEGGVSPEQLQSTVQAALLPLIVNKEEKHGVVTLTVTIQGEHFRELSKNPGLFGASILRSLK